jgi:hypothetical protein
MGIESSQEGIEPLDLGLSTINSQLPTVCAGVVQW